jgi:subtilase family protein
MQNGSPTNRAVEWYHPGEVVIVGHVRRGGLDPQRVHARLREQLGNQVPTDPSSLRSFTFDAPREPMSLVFLIQQLVNADTGRSVKQVVESLHGRLGALGGDDLQVLTATPHWHVKAQEGFFGGSPASDPVPFPATTTRDRPAYREYVPMRPELKPNPAPNANPIRVAVLDTHWHFETVRRRAEQFRDKANNQQLLDTIQRLGQSMHGLDDYDAEWQRVNQCHAGMSLAGAEPGTYHMPDHGLFIAGLIHAMAPQARLSYQPVLDDMGLGDLSLLLLGLQRVLADKAEGEPQIINLSLGFLPHPARLPAAWYGLPRPHDPLYVYSSALSDPERDQRWVSANREHVDRTVDLLQVGLRELARYLKLNNCLVIAAAGNDSLLPVESGHVRMQPRLPARFESVLGVAATTSRPTEAAAYSNLGDERELGDHVATFGGSIPDAQHPDEGVIGIYAGEFPDRRPNETGWAVWSGTSFAAAIVSGIAAHMWASAPTLNAAEVLAQTHAAASATGHYVPELRTPSIAVEGRWH